MEKFYLGMDIGTDSVGMACTDENYNLLRAKRKDLWSVRLFEEAQTAASRRSKRTARRRLERCKTRIDFLQGIFAPYMEDDKFFLRLNNSGFYEEDKAEGLNSRFSLFSDNDYTDIDFYREYPTIFHLRKALVKEERKDGKPYDLRLYYLALHHIIKYRGHFLFSGGEDTSGIPDIKKLLEDFNKLVMEVSSNADNGFSLFDEKMSDAELERLSDKVNDILLSKDNITDKKKKLFELFNVKAFGKKDPIKPAKEGLLAILVGGKVALSDMFFDENLSGEKICFAKLDDDSFQGFSSKCDSDQFLLLAKAREIYNYALFKKIVPEKYKYISEAMVAIYEKHKEDLKRLKALIKTECGDKYYEIFRAPNVENNYVSYVGYTLINGKKLPAKKHAQYDGFKKYLESILKCDLLKDNEEAKQILIELAEENFLPKIINADNGLFPHQINGAELKNILKNLEKDYPCFSEKDEDGVSLSKKIEDVFLYKIPYYVGPLNGVEKENGKRTNWVVRKQSGAITPWNFEDKIDLAKSNEGFIRRMTNKCTYLHGKDVLPKNSMYYQAFNVLNVINKLTIGSVPLDVKIKQDIFNNVFLKYKKVTEKNIANYLVREGRVDVDLKENPLGGFDKEVGIKVSMSSFVTFAKMFGEEFVKEHSDIFENIILWHTLNSEKRFVAELIEKNYGEIPEIKAKLNDLKGLTFDEFGRLSKELLVELRGVDKTTGELCTILQSLYNTNYHFNQLLFLDDYTFSDEIKKANSLDDGEITEDDIEKLYVSPAVKRGVRQTIRMTEEYVEAVEKVPDKIFIEVTRHDEEKKRTKSRKDKLLELYKNTASLADDVERMKNELEHKEYTDSNLRSERLYLYFLQLGRCAYTGERIDLEQLSTDLYDVDHIMPRSKTKDDSIDNKVLVKREKNKIKSDMYPLPVGFTNQQSFWKMLKEKGLMSEKKYALLTRVKPLDENDFKAFVARQLVVTDQTAIAVRDILEKKYKPLGTKIVLSKASNVNDFKQKFDIVKCRETNDLHHARDAYLNIVVGNVYDTKFTSAHDYMIRYGNDSWREYNLDKLYERPIANAWKGKDDIGRIKAIVSKTSMSVTRYSYTNKGMFYDETVYPKTDEGIKAPRKEFAPYNNVSKYGGYKSLKTAYFAIVESKGKKNKTIKTIEAIPVLIDYKSKNNPNAVQEYLLQSGLKEPRIIVPKLKIKTLVSVNGTRVWIAGMTGKQIILHNANQWFTDPETDQYIKQATKYVERVVAKSKASDKKEEEPILEERIPLMKNRKEVTLFATKEINEKIYVSIIEKLERPTYCGLSSVNNFREKLKSKKETFERLTTFEQIQVLLQIVRFMKCNADLSDLSILNDGSNCGALLIGKDITDVDFAIVHQSPCGLKERIQKV